MTADELRALREHKDWTRRRVAAALGVSVRTVEDWESGRRAIPEPAARLLLILAGARKPKV